MGYLQWPKKLSIRETQNPSFQAPTGEAMWCKDWHWSMNGTTIQGWLWLQINTPKEKEKGETRPSITAMAVRDGPGTPVTHPPTQAETAIECSPGCSWAHCSKPKFSLSTGGCLTVEVNEVAPTYIRSELALWIAMYRVGYSNSVVAKTRHLCQSIWQVHWYMSANCLRYLLKNYSNFFILKYLNCTMIRKWLQRQNANKCLPENLTVCLCSRNETAT